MRLLSSLSSFRSAFVLSHTLAPPGVERNVKLSVVVGSDREAYRADEAGALRVTVQRATACMAITVGAENAIRANNRGFGHFREHPQLTFTLPPLHGFADAWSTPLSGEPAAAVRSRSPIKATPTHPASEAYCLYEAGPHRSRCVPRIQCFRWIHMRLSPSELQICPATRDCCLPRIQTDLGLAIDEAGRTG